MKRFKNLIWVLPMLAFLGLASCEDNYITGDNAGDVVKVYLPGAANENNLYSILDGGEIVIDTTTKTVNFPISVFRSGFAKYEPLTVDVAVDDAKVNSLVQAGALPENTVTMSADDYVLDENCELTDQTFLLKGAIIPKIKLSKLDDYEGKTVAMAVNISNPSMYEINEEMNTIVFYFDVDELRANYLSISIDIVNPGFEDNYSGWETESGAAELKNATGREGNDLNFWSSSVTSGYVLQSIDDLPNGNYTVSAWYKMAGNNMYLYANGESLTLTPTGSWIQVSLDFTVTNHVAEFGFKAIDAGGNFSAWEPWCDMDDFTLIQKL